ncbi:MAG: leucine-rich repeat protein [Akkermansiaceae bacterium]|nr:leucine-rich repeat protein [Akkermansiaceae bacterium]
MKYSKVSNTFFTATIKNLLVMPFALLVISWDAGDTKLGGINFDELENKKDLFYLKESDDPYTGEVFKLYENGKKEGQGSLKDGKPEGLTTSWYESGQKKYEENWKDGKKEGLMTSWHKNGKKKTERIIGSGYSPPRFWNSRGQEVDSLEETEDRKFSADPPSLGEIPEKALGYKVEDDSVTITGYYSWEQFEIKQRRDHLWKGSGAWTIPKLIKGKPVTCIGADAFNNDSMNHLEIPDTVVNIERRAFEGMKYLRSIAIGAGVKSIGHQAFWFSTNLKQVTFLGNAPKLKTGILFYEATPTIYRKADAKGWGDTFAGRPVRLIIESSLEEASSEPKLPKTVSVKADLKYETESDAVTITGCNKRASGELSIPAIIEERPVTSIEKRAFFYCKSLTNVTIGNGVTSIGGVAFENCTNLTTVNFLGDAPKIGDNAFKESSPTIYREPDAKGWGDTLAGRPVKLITEKP